MKEYLKMSDVFPDGVYVGTEEWMNGWFEVRHVGGSSIDESCDGGYSERDANYVAHAINSHDELVENYMLASKERDEWEARAYKEGSNAHNLQVHVDALSDLIERAAYIFYLSGSTSRDGSLNPIEQWLFDAEKNKGA